MRKEEHKKRSRQPAMAEAGAPLRKRRRKDEDEKRVNEVEREDAGSEVQPGDSSEAEDAAGVSGADGDKVPSKRTMQVREKRKKKQEKRKLFLNANNLAKDTTEEDVRDFFQSAGPLQGVLVQETKQPNVMGAIVHFGSIEAAEAALKLNGGKMKGRAVRVGLAKPEHIKEMQESEAARKSASQPPAQPGAKGAKVKNESATSIFVGSLAYNTTADDLRAFFRGCGVVSGVKLLFEEDGRSKCCAVVTFKDAGAREKALTKNGAVLQERTIRVERQTTHAERAGVAPIISHHNRLFASDIPFSASEDSIYAAFSKFGAIRDIRYLENESGQFNGHAVLDYVRPESVTAALSSGPVIINGRELRLDFSKNKRARELQQEYGILKAYDTSVLFTGVPASLPESEVKAFLVGKCGAAKSFKVLAAPDPNGHRQVFVQFAAPASVSVALGLSGFKWKKAKLLARVIAQKQLDSAVRSVKQEHGQDTDV